MTTPERAFGNRIGGEEQPGASGARFDVIAAQDGAALGSWPRSDASDVRAALDALAAAALELERAEPERRRDKALEAAERFGADEAAAAWLAARLFVTPAELAPHRCDLGARVAPRLPGPAPAEELASARIALVLSDWTELLLGLAVAVLGELVAGRPVLLLADARTPRVADALADAILQAGLPAGALAVIHGAGGEALRAAARAPAVGRAVVSGSPSRVLALQQAAAARAADQPLERLEDIVHGREELIEPGADLAAAAQHVLDGAFGRSRTLSGQLAGRIEVVRCPQRSFSAFSAALLAALEASPDVADPVPLIDREAVEMLSAALSLGLDEGATLIHGGEPLAHSRGRAVRPIVFTNVEEDSELLRRFVPGPLLRLVRDERGRGQTEARYAWARRWTERGLERGSSDA